MKTNRFFKLRWAEWLVIFATLAVFVVLLLPALRSRGGPWLPKDPPAEDRRVFHPKGFSIISPPGWQVTTKDYGQDWALLVLAPGDKLRDGPRLAAGAIAPQPNLSEFQETTFLGGKAYSRVDFLKGRYIRCSYKLAINHSNQWYEVTYSESRASDANPSSEIPEIMMLYLRSFRPSEK